MTWNDVTFFALVLASFALILTALTLGVRRIQRVVFGRAELPYASRGALNTPTEQAFYAALHRAVGAQTMIACKVRLADVLKVRFRKRYSNDQRWWRYFRQISAKHVDMVLCEPRGGHVLLAIELDDRSHLRRDRRRSDRFKDRAFAAAGIPLVRFAASGRYDAQDIHARLAPYLVPQEKG
ncbi:DUF2726 domain-containing protein [Pistricoccus aurantiacus]|uniref:DUF2726 domain-containing protein n=1 Tax=Pistricoccus aurantiacus TaxID=1883414 RepID=UPI00164909B7|nr:DUF2726 domain-containing protein [Pistricoccus aurantiacus]